MSDALRFFDDMIEERLTQLHTAMPCRVERYDEQNGTADVVPLFMRRYEDGRTEAMPRLNGLPVVKRRYRRGGELVVEVPVYEPGDIVLVVFAERALDMALATRRPVDPEFARKYALDDGIVIGLL